jgi:anaerobic magnesium-protoporphyrin IX monomethyl ester cyclase
MKILFIRPPDTALGEFKKVGGAQHPVNLLYLAEWVENCGHQASILDLEVEEFDDDSFSRRVKEVDVVGITVMTPHMRTVGELVGQIKQLGKPVILGGPHPSVLPEDALAETGADIAVVGEGETALAWILDDIDRARQTRVVRKPLIDDLDELPVPDRTRLNLDAYKGFSTPGIFKKSTVLFTSRGCPFNCDFCAAKHIHGRRYRFRSIESLRKELNEIRTLGFHHVTIDDDSFTVKRDRTLEFCDMMVEEFPDMTFDCDSRVDAVDAELLHAMKRAGCIKIAFGVESGSPRLLKQICKQIRVEQAIEAFDLSRREGIETQAFFTVGHLTETPEDIEKSRALIKRLKPDFLFVSVVTPYPGTALYDDLKAAGKLEGLDWHDFAFFKKHVPWSTDQFTGGQLAEIRDRMLRNYYFSPGFIFGKLLRLRSPAQLRYYLYSAWALVRHMGKKHSS